MHGKRKPGKKQAAASAAYAASKQKASVVQISADNEDRVRSALQEVGLGEDSNPEAERLRQTGRRVSEAALADVYGELLEHGFQPAHIRQAMQAIATHSLTTEVALDWLCMHLDSADLPRRFAAGARSTAAGSSVKLVAKARADAPQPQPRNATDTGNAFLPSAHPQPSSAPAKEAVAEDDKEARRAWIMQYMDDDSGSDSDDVKDAGPEVWELFADPREIERRRAERRKASLPPEARRAQLAAEYAQAKAEAALAKLTADRPRQKAAGQLIRDLKLEMAQLGLTEQAALEMHQRESSPSATPENGFEDDAVEESDFADWPLELPGENQAAPSAEAEDTTNSDQPSISPAAQDPGTASDNEQVPPSAAGHETRKSSGSSESDVELEMGMFDEDCGGLDWDAPAVASKGPEKKLLGPWGDYETPAPSRKAGKQRPKGNTAEAAPTAHAPKALLQQHCQRQQLPAPRFEKLAVGGLRLEQAGMRYAVTAEAAQAGPGGGRRKRRGPRTFQLREEEDGWETIAEAQNAVATRALYELVPDQPLYRLLAPPFRDLWLAWDAQGVETAQRQKAEEDADRLAFVQSLLTAERASPSLQSQGGADVAPTASSPATEQPPEEKPHPIGAGRQLTAQQSQEGERMQQAWAAFQASEAGRRWQADRAKLPVAQIRAELLQALQSDDVVVVSGDTGCGKTTQVPQYLLEEAVEAGRGGACSIVVTQPRRIAAISVAERVASERGEPPPGAPGSRVGYHVRLDAATTRDTRLLFCTTGILLRRLAGQPALDGTTHVIVDEVHERTLQGDFLMALLRDLVPARRQHGAPLKVILMSATLDAALFSQYYGACAMLKAAGRTFPVQQFFLEDAYEVTGYRLAPDSPAALRPGADQARRRQQMQKAASSSQQALIKSGWGDEEADAGAVNRHYDPDLYQEYSLPARRNLARVDEARIDYDLLEDLVAHIDSQHGEGAILVFLPGMGEISKLHERLCGLARFRRSSQWIIPLHSTVSAADQRRAFLRPPAGARKVVLATNIAETSLTIEDVVYVVDTGKLKERRHDPTRGMSLLVEDFVSQASAKQRRGRAGRVQPGMCFGLYTRHRFEHRLRKYQAPEMVRVPLEELVLQIHLLGLGPAAAFLQRVLEPPPAKSVAGAVATLQQVGALTPDEQLTALGHHLAQLPVDARVGKLLLLAACLGCLGPALTIAAALSYKAPFSASWDQQDATQRAKLAMAAPGAQGLAAGQQSDHLLMAEAFRSWAQAGAGGGRKAAHDFARRNFLSASTLEMLADMRAQFASMLADISFVSAPRNSRRDHGWMDDPGQAWNRFATHPAVVKAVLCAALYPNVAVMDDAAKRSARPGWNDGTAEVAIHPSSVAHMLEAHQFLRPYLIYLEKMKTSRTFLRDVSVVSPMALLLFGGSLSVVHEGGYVLVDDWLRIRAPAQTAVLVKQLRRALDALLQRRVGRPDAAQDSAGGQIIDSIVKLLDEEEAALRRDRQ